MVKWSRKQDGHYSRYKYNRWILETSVFKLILRMQAVIIMLVLACILIDIMDLIPSIKFLVRKTRRRLSQLEGRVGGNGCSLRIKFPHQETRRWHEEEVGRFVRRIGNLWPAFSCIPWITTIREMDSSFVEVQVCIGGSVPFVEVETIIL